MKIALIQQKYHNSRDVTIKNSEIMIKEAVDNGAKLVVLQELHTTHYFCQYEDVDNFIYADNFTQDKEIFSSIAKKYQVVIVTSLFEKALDGIYYNSAVVFESNGEEAGVYHKHHIPDDPGFYEKFYFTPGDEGFFPINTSVGKLGVMICWDQWYPEAARLMSLAGADILIYPTAIGWFDNDTKEEKKSQLNSWLVIQQAHSVANAISVVAVNRVGFEKDSSGVLDGIRFWGNSFVTDTRGNIIAQATPDQQQIIYANVDFNKTKQTRQIWPFFRDRRIDTYQGLTKRLIKI